MFKLAKLQKKTKKKQL